MKDNNDKGCVLNIFALIIFLNIVCFLVYKCNSNIEERKDLESKEKKAAEIKAKKESSDFKKQYDFDIYELCDVVKKCKVGEFKTYKPSSPIIIYKQLNYLQIFEYSYPMNKNIGSKYISFSKDSIKTIVILRDTLVDIGRYSGRNNTRAIQRQTIISYVDFNTKKEIYYDIVKGEEPPESIRSRSALGDRIVGPFPNETEILETIKKNIN